MATYMANTGLDYGTPSKRVEAGEFVSDLPSKSISWLLAQNLIELVEDSAPAKNNSKTEKVVEEEAI